MHLVHPRISTAVLTCIAAPEQWEGQLADGRAFYFRYRFGRATLATGPTPADVAGITNPLQNPQARVSLRLIGDHLDGSFDDDAARTFQFGRLLEAQGGA